MNPTVDNGQIRVKLGRDSRDNSEGRSVVNPLLFFFNSFFASFILAYLEHF